MSQSIFIVGAGGHGQSVAEAIQRSEIYRIAGFVDDALVQGEMISGVPVLGKIDQMSAWFGVVQNAVVALGDNHVRRKVSKMLQQFGFEFGTVIHPDAIIAPSASIASGSVILAGAIIGTGAKLGEGVIVNCGAVVDHHCHVGEFAHLGVNAAMAGGASLGALASLQAGAVIGVGAKVEPERVVFLREAVL